MGKNFCNLQRANIQNLQRIETDSQEENEQTHPKVGEGYEQILFKKKTYMKPTNL